VHRLTRQTQYLLLVHLLHVCNQGSDPGDNAWERTQIATSSLWTNVPSTKSTAPVSPGLPGEHGIRYERCRVSAISEDPHTHELILHYADANGHPLQERFEMVVLAIGVQPPESAQYFTQMLDLELNEYGFCRTDKFTPLQTSHSGVFVCGAFSSPKEISETILDASGSAAEVMRLLNDRLNTYPATREFPFLSAGEFPEERDVGDQPARVGIFSCSCGGTIGEVIDIPGLAEVAGGFPGVVTSEVLDFACFPEGLDRIQKRIDETAES
jgi:heterodisulfide reductase subunit A